MDIKEKSAVTTDQPATIYYEHNCYENTTQNKQQSLHCSLVICDICLGMINHHRCALCLDMINHHR